MTRLYCTLLPVPVARSKHEPRWRWWQRRGSHERESLCHSSTSGGGSGGSRGNRANNEQTRNETLYLNRKKSSSVGGGRGGSSGGGGGRGGVDCNQQDKRFFAPKPQGEATSFRRGEPAAAAACKAAITSPPSQLPLRTEAARMVAVVVTSRITTTRARTKERLQVPKPIVNADPFHRPGVAIQRYIPISRHLGRHP